MLHARVGMHAVANEVQPSDVGSAILSADGVDFQHRDHGCRTKLRTRPYAALRIRKSREVGPMSNKKTPTLREVVGDLLIHFGTLIALSLVALLTCLYVASFDIPLLTRLTCYLFAVVTALTFWRRTYLPLNVVGVMVLSLLFILFAEAAWVPRLIGLPELQRIYPAD